LRKRRKGMEGTGKKREIERREERNFCSADKITHLNPFEVN
jgi:hypothetical protein